MGRKINVPIEFGEQLQKYLDHFGLVKADIAKFLNSNSDSISDILTGEKNVVLKTAERIANIFGIRYYELGNPKFPLPDFENIPQQTQKAILNRKEIGITETVRNNELKLPLHIETVLSSGMLPEEFTATDIWRLLPSGTQSLIEAIRITHLLKKGKVRHDIEDTGNIRKSASGKGRGEILFRIKE